jgi:hypothetical protein
MSRLRLAKLDRRRPNAVAVKDAGRGRSDERGGCLACGFCMKMLSRVIVELLLVKDGTPSTEIRTSGPGSPMSREWKLSSVKDEGAVEILCVSYETGVLGDGNDDDCVMEYGLIGASEEAGKCKGLTSTGERSLDLSAWRGDAVGESVESNHAA